ncbi:MAG: AMP-binding protein, partial [Myxococcota bacterium]
MGDFRNLVELYERSIKKYANNPLFGVKRDGRYQWMTYREFGEQVDAFRGALAALGIGEGDTVAIIADNRVEWAVIAYATYGRGASYCPMYESQLQKEWEYIVRDSGAKLLVAADADVFEKVRGFTETIDTLEGVVVLSEGRGVALEHTYAKLLDRGRKAPVAPMYPGPDVLAGFIYTSGTTGNPKGVLLTNENMCFNVQSIVDLGIIEHEDVSLAFLPWAHSFGQNCELHAMFAMGAAMGLVESVSTIVDNMGEVRPTILFAVPRIFHRIHDGLQKRIAHEPPLRQRVFAAAMANAEAMREQEDMGGANIATAAMNKIFDATVFSTVRERFGGRLRMAVSGGAALSPEIGRFIDNLKIRVYEGYGLTETSPLVSVNLPGARKIGSVGYPSTPLISTSTPSRGRPTL